MVHRPECDFSNEVCHPFFWEGERQCGKKHGVLLLHGFTGTIAHMRPLAESLHALGFTVMGINLPGHGETMDAMARCTWEDWLNAAKESLLQLKEQCDIVSAAGLSMGGCLALILAEQMQVDAVAAISAPMGTKAPLWVTGLASPFVKTVWWRSREGTASLLNTRYDCGYPGFRTKCGPQLNRLIHMCRRDLHAVTCPVLVVQSHADETITSDSADVILAGVSSERKGVLWLDDVPHVCTISKEAEHIAQVVGEHFRWAQQH